MKKQSNTKRLHVRCYYECFCDTYIDVDKNMTLKQAFQYADKHKDDLALTNLELLPDSAELDEVDIENPDHTFFES